MDNHGKSAANTCIKAPQGVAFISLRWMQGQLCLVSHDKDADRMNLFRRQFVRLSALSTLDGSVVDYHGVYG